MKAEITKEGYISITAETPVEAYAIQRILGDEPDLSKIMIDLTVISDELLKE